MKKTARIMAFCLAGLMSCLWALALAISVNAGSNNIVAFAIASGLMFVVLVFAIPAAFYYLVVGAGTVLRSFLR